MLIKAIKVNDIENIGEILKYCDKNSIVFDKDEGGRYPFYHSVVNNNINMTQMIIYYANKNQIKLKINDNSPNGWYPFLIAVSENNIQTAQTIIDYSIKNKIKLKINDKHRDGWYLFIFHFTCFLFFK